MEVKIQKGRIQLQGTSDPEHAQRNRHRELRLPRKTGAPPDTRVRLRRDPLRPRNRPPESDRVSPRHCCAIHIPEPWRDRTSLTPEPLADQDRPCASGKSLHPSRPLEMTIGKDLAADYKRPSRAQSILFGGPL